MRWVSIVELNKKNHISQECGSHYHTTWTPFEVRLFLVKALRSKLSWRQLLFPKLVNDISPCNPSMSLDSIKATFDTPIHSSFEMLWLNRLWLFVSFFIGLEVCFVILIECPYRTNPLVLPRFTGDTSFIIASATDNVEKSKCQQYIAERRRHTTSIMIERTVDVTLSSVSV